MTGCLVTDAWWFGSEEQVMQMSDMFGLQYVLDVFQDSRRKKIRLLTHNPELRSKGAEVIVPHVHAVQNHFAMVHVVETLQEREAGV